MDIETLAASLRSAVAALHKRLRKQMSAVSTYSMTEIEAIGLLARHEKMLPTELAGLTRIKTQSMSQILNKMETQGIIKKTASREDKRKVYISLTASGKRMVAKTRYERDEWLRSMIEKTLTGKEKEQLTRILPVLQKLTATS